MKPILINCTGKFFYRSENVQNTEAATGGVFKNLTKFTGKCPCQGLFFHKVADLKPATLVKKETPTQVFSCELCEIFKNTFCKRLFLKT